MLFRSTHTLTHIHTHVHSNTHTLQHTHTPPKHNYVYLPNYQEEVLASTSTSLPFTHTHTHTLTHTHSQGCCGTTPTLVHLTFFLPVPPFIDLSLPPPPSSSPLSQRTESQPRQSHLFSVVVAIDFGTISSGYAFSFTHDPEAIHMMR